MDKITRFYKEYKDRIDTLINDMQEEMDHLYLTNKEWEEISEEAIEPLNQALAYLEDKEYNLSDDIEEQEDEVL